MLILLRVFRTLPSAPSFSSFLCQPYGLWPRAYDLWPMTTGLASFSAKQRSSKAAKQRSSKATKKAVCAHRQEELNGCALVGDKAGLARRPSLGQESRSAKKRTYYVSNCTCANIVLNRFFFFSKNVRNSFLNLIKGKLSLYYAIILFLYPTLKVQAEKKEGSIKQFKGKKEYYSKRNNASPPPILSFYPIILSYPTSGRQERRQACRQRLSHNTGAQSHELSASAKTKISLTKVQQWSTTK